MYTNQPNHPTLPHRLAEFWRHYSAKRSLIFGVIIFGALIAFEIFNYSTTDFALTNLLGEVSFVGVRWATILALAFCGMDFAGVARLFTPDKEFENKTEVWYLLGAWFLAAGMNALLTWWGVSLALLDHPTLGNEILSRDTLLTLAPIFVAVMVLLIRILVIGTFSMAGNQVFAHVNETLTRTQHASAPAQRPAAPPPARAAPRPTPPPNYGDWDDRFIGGSNGPSQPSRVMPKAQPPQSAPPTAPRPAPPPPQARIVPKPAPKPVPPVQANGTPSNRSFDFDDER
ncbi:MAG: hypothetical protein ACT4QE_25420 [Anaerolineales bacterium]